MAATISDLLTSIKTASTDAEKIQISQKINDQMPTGKTLYIQDVEDAAADGKLPKLALVNLADALTHKDMSSESATARSEEFTRVMDIGLGQNHPGGTHTSYKSPTDTSDLVGHDKTTTAPDLSAHFADAHDGVVPANAPAPTSQPTVQQKMTTPGLR